jgi:hypothetical protein
VRDEQEKKDTETKHNPTKQPLSKPDKGTALILWFEDLANDDGMHHSLLFSVNSL